MFVSFRVTRCVYFVSLCPGAGTTYGGYGRASRGPDLRARRSRLRGPGLSRAHPQQLPACRYRAHFKGPPIFPTLRCFVLQIRSKSAKRHQVFYAPSTLRHRYQITMTSIPHPQLGFLACSLYKARQNEVMKIPFSMILLSVCFAEKEKKIGKTYFIVM